MSGKRPRLENVERESVAIVPEQIEKLKELFPEAVSEGKVDFDKLRATLGEFADDRPERYSFTWAGKRDCIKLLQVPSRATLVPSPDESIDWDTTNNVFIEGENLEVLKLLYKAYYGRVKMIYIDPPYNIDAGMIYPDNLTDPLDFYLRQTGQKDNEGNVLTSKPEASGRIHSGWLSSIYPRLLVARQLLRDDGVILASVNDAELLSLQHAMNEVLGEENLLGVFVWKSRAKPTNAGAAIYRCQRVAEYVLAYGRSSAQTQFFPLNSGEKRSYPFEDRGRKYRTTTILTSNRGRYRRESMRFALEDFTPSPEQRWKAGPAEIHDLRKRGYVEFRDGIPFLKHYEDEERDEHDPLWTYLPEAWTGTAETGKEELSDLVGPAHGLDSVKPVSLIRLFVQAFTEGGDIVLDFYAGSCTTAHAVWEENLWGEHGCRNCIMVQYPEPSPKSSFSTIAELGKERMRRAGQMLKGHTPQQTDLMKPIGHLDMGFRVFKVAESNMKPWKGTDEKDPEKYAKTMEMFLDPLVEGWKSENVIAEVAMKEAGFGLNCRTERIGHENTKDTKRKNGAPTIFKVTDTDKEQFFYICLGDKVRLEDVKFLNLTRDMLFVCRDVALDDETAANLALQCRLRTV